MRSKFVGPSNMVIYESPGNQAAGQLASGQQIEAAPITSLKPQLRWPKNTTRGTGTPRDCHIRLL